MKIGDFGRKLDRFLKFALRLSETFKSDIRLPEKLVGREIPRRDVDRIRPPASRSRRGRYRYPGKSGRFAPELR